MRKMWILAFLAGFLSVQVHGVAVVDTLRYFEFPDESPVATDPYAGGDNSLVRQGIIANGTVFTVPQVGQNFPPITNPILGIAPNIVNNGSSCTCVPTGQCTGGTLPPTGNGNFGDGQIDIRIIGGGATGTGTIVASSSPAPALTSGYAVQVATCPSTALQLCCVTGPYQCGKQYPAITGAPTPPTSDSAYFGQFPWQVVLLTTGDVYVGSGVLIDNFNVLTVAHRVVNYRTGQFLKVRLGEWDASGTREPIPAQEFIVTRVTIHPQFIQTSLRNDVAVLRLATPVPLGQTPTIATACLTTQVVTGQRCFVSGWGRNAFVNGQYQTVQKQTDVPLVDQTTCQNQLRSTRLGATFTLDTTSFICAGGESGKDACTGDGGSPLVCNLNGRWFAIGLVAWGIGCATQGVPGVYVNLVSYIPWIQQQVFS